jgi:hypothetical protein
MGRMKLRYLIYLALTGFVSPLLLLLPLVADPTQPGRLSQMLVIPGHLVESYFLSKAERANVPPAFSIIEFAVNLLAVWFVMVMASILLDKFVELLIVPRKEHA